MLDRIDSEGRLAQPPAPSTAPLNAHRNAARALDAVLTWVVTESGDLRAAAPAAGLPLELQGRRLRPDRFRGAPFLAIALG